MQSTDRQVRRLMEEFKKHGKVGRAALRADMDRKTSRKYLAADKLPSELKEPRTWRTRADPKSELGSPQRRVAEAVASNLLGIVDIAIVPNSIRTVS